MWLSIDRVSAAAQARVMFEMREAGMRILLAAAGATLFVSGAALAQSTAIQTSNQGDRDKVVCKSEPIIGSHLSERICRTKGEWDAARTTDQRVLDRRNGELRAPKPKGSGG